MPLDGTQVTNPVIEMLREGRAKIERGWCQRISLSPTGAVCALGALSEPSGFIKITAATEALRAAAGAGHLSEISRWNDSPERTQADVLALYDRAIAMVIAKEMENKA